MFTTKYKNNVRTISGAGNNLFDDDVVLLCDTSAGPVGINLSVFEADYWSTQNKIYVFDVSGNAAANNITITAPAGYTINGASSLAIDHNTGGAIIRVLANTAYQASLSYCCGSGGGLVVLTNAALKTLITDYAIALGTHYYVTDPLNADIAVIVYGTSPSTVSVEGRGLFLNADYNNVGYYGEGVTPANVGVWNTLLSGLVANQSVAIWNGLHYKNTTGLNSADAPPDSPDTWTLMVKAKEIPYYNGYIEVSDFVKYNVDQNLVIYRADNFDNEVDYFDDGKGTEAIAVFQWGNGTKVYGNKVSSAGLLDCLNNNSSRTSGIITYNKVSERGRISGRDNAGTINANVLYAGGFLSIAGNIGTFAGNLLYGSAQFNMEDNSATVSKNVACQTANINYHSNSKLLSGNTFGKKALCTFTGNTGTIETCEFNAELGFNLTTNTTNLSGKKCVPGYSDFEKTLDLSDAAIYDLPTKTITIPAYSTFIGIFTTTNSTGLIVEKIATLPTNHIVTFYPTDTETITWQHTLVASSVANDLLCDAPGSANFLTGRTDGNDFISYKKSGTKNVRTNLFLSA